MGSVEKTSGPANDAAVWRQRAMIAEFELAMMRQNQATTVAIAAGLPEEAQALRLRLAAIESSHSWRLTAPVRAAINILRRVKSRFDRSIHSVGFPAADNSDVMAQKAHRLDQYSTPSDRKVWQDLLLNSKENP